MTSQERGLTTVAAAVRALMPPQLEAVIIVYPPDRPDQISSCMALAKLGVTGAEHLAAVERAKVAAKTFAVVSPNGPGFNPQS